MEVEFFQEPFVHLLQWLEEPCQKLGFCLKEIPYSITILSDIRTGCTIVAYLRPMVVL